MRITTKILSFAVSFCSIAAASEPVTEKELVEKLRLYESISTLEASFKQTKTIKDLDVELKSEGKFKLVRPDKVFWEIVKPSPVKVALDSREIRIVSGVGKEARTQILKLGDSLPDKAARSMGGLVVWLNLDARALFREYEISPGGANRYRFEPREKSGSPFTELEMTLGKDGHLSRLLIHEVSGDQLEIGFGKPKLTKK